MIDILDSAIIGFYREESGAILAFRNNGEDVLFASRGSANGPPAPLRWIKVSEFTPDPKLILSAEEAMNLEEEEDDA